ncbi:hypothetical protein KKB40_04135 [Patescibacteria group bacterium]|nr:hypothetical protein [Patescibacteria group bacterium]
MLFYDHLIILEDLGVEIKNIVETSEEREELWQLIDEIIHHRVLGCIFDCLPDEHHHHFLTMFHDAPHDCELVQFINELADTDIEDVIRGELSKLQKELLQEMFEENF